MGLTKKEIGNLGEEYTVRFLRSKGCEILARNFTVRGGELDIVAKKGDILHIVEVKTRKPDPLSSGAEAITPKKIANVVRAASEYIARNEIDLSCVFDVAIVEVDGGEVIGFEYIQRAFTA